MAQQTTSGPPAPGQLLPFPEMKPMYNLHQPSSHPVRPSPVRPSPVRPSQPSHRKAIPDRMDVWDVNVEWSFCPSVRLSVCPSVLLLVEKMVDEDNTWVTFISGNGEGQKLLINHILRTSDPHQPYHPHQPHRPSIHTRKETIHNQGHQPNVRQCRRPCHQLQTGEQVSKLINHPTNLSIQPHRPSIHSRNETIQHINQIYPDSQDGSAMRPSIHARRPSNTPLDLSIHATGPSIHARRPSIIKVINQTSDRVADHVTNSRQANRYRS